MEDKLIRDAQYRKGLSIAFFNATNAAIELVKNSVFVKNGEISKDEEYIKALVVKYRNFFLKEHQEYYATVIAKVGTNFNPEETKIKLSKATSVESLKSIWLSLSEDERRDPTIITFTQELKKKYEKA